MKINNLLKQIIYTSNNEVKMMVFVFLFANKSVVFVLVH